MLIIAGGDDDASEGATAALFPVVGQTLIEYQVRIARACGGGHIVVLVDQFPAALVAAFDRLRADGIEIDVARDARDAADRIHPDEQLLLFTPGLVADKRLVADLAGQSKPTLLTLADAPAVEGFERIDATERWAGLALLNGQILRETVAMLGDWSMGSTLMRRALQSGAARMRLANPVGLANVTSAAQAQAISDVLVHSARETSDTAFGRTITSPLAQILTPILLRRRVPLDLMIMIPLLLAGAAALLALLGWLTAAFATLLVAALGEAVVTVMTSVIAKRPRFVDMFKRAILPVFCAVLLITGWTMRGDNGGWAALILALWAASTLLIERPMGDTKRVLAANADSGALIMTVALLIGQPIAGLVAIVLHSVAARIVDRFFND